MFGNSGSKLKVIAWVLMILQIAGCVFFGVHFMLQETPDYLLGGLIIAVGIFTACLWALLCYAIGVCATAAEKADRNNEAIIKRINALDRKIGSFLAETAARAARTAAAAERSEDQFRARETEKNKK